MMFENILGNEHVKKYLTNMVVKNTVGNSLLFAGPEGIGKSLFALDFAKMLLGLEALSSRQIENHPDIHIYRPEGKIGMHSIDTMRQFTADVFLAPLTAKRKVFIIHDADRMLTYSANALLKTFEEPSLDSVIILLSSSPDTLIPTILSRCRTVRFHEIDQNLIQELLEKKYQKSVGEAKVAAALSEGSIGNALRYLNQSGDALRHQLLKVFANGKFSSYTHLMQTAKQIGDVIEESKKQEEELLREELFKGKKSEFTAAQIQALEKEIDGAVSIRQLSHAKGVFKIILSWYRDMHLLMLNGNRQLLMNPDYINEIDQSLQRGEIHPIEFIQEVVADLKLSLERSTPFYMSLERLFLTLEKG